MKIKPKKKWVVVSDNGTAFIWTISDTKAACAKLLYKDMTEKERHDFWDKNLSNGWYVLKVNIKFEEQ
jgi:hypothetical protein